MCKNYVFIQSQTDYSIVPRIDDKKLSYCLENRAPASCFRLNKMLLTGIRLFKVYIMVFESEAETSSQTDDKNNFQHKRHLRVTQGQAF